MKTRNKILIGGAIVIAYLLWDRNRKKNNLTASNVASGGTSSAPTNESTNLDLPSGMDLPNLTPSTSVPTEVAIQESIAVVPTPAIVPSKPTDTETALNNSLINPIEKDKEAERLAILEQQLQAEKRAELDRLLLLQQQLTTALPKTAQSISVVEEIPVSEPIIADASRS